MYCRVRYIENPWYDDHFDIPTERQRIGKTLTMIAGAGSDLLSRGSLLVGWALYEKLDSVQSLMMEWLDDDSKTPLVTAAMVCTWLFLFDSVVHNLFCPMHPFPPSVRMSFPLLKIIYSGGSRWGSLCSDEAPSLIP